MKEQDSVYPKEQDSVYPDEPDEEAERRAREAIRRSFDMPYKPQKEMFGKVGRPARHKRAPSKATKPPE
jgi:hypothetical protein